MSDEPDLTLRALRTGALEWNVASLMVPVADLSAHMDGFDLRLTRIERGLDLVDERAAS